MDQEVKYLKIKDLVLWNENPRDPINPDATDQEIVNKALTDKLSKWTLPKLAKEMGDYYDLSELPTVVYHNEKPVVYDGNRRIILGKIKLNLVEINSSEIVTLPDFPDEIPCNVCIQEIALKNVYRKHSDSGSWLPLERDIFLHKFMHEDKSAFLILEEDTGIISANPYLNQRFVKEEIFKEDSLKLMGFSIDKGKLNTVHNSAEGRSILSDIAQKIKVKKISTRHNRGKVLDVLDQTSLNLIQQNKKKEAHLAEIQFNNQRENKEQRQSKRSQKKESELFGGKIYLKIGDVSDLHRDITDLYYFYITNKSTLSHSFTGLIRMSLRLLCETAANSKNKKMNEYLKSNFEKAKKILDQDTKTTLANQNVNSDTITQLLHTGAHNYKSSNSMEQTIALSIIIGAILITTHGRGDKSE